MVLFVQLGIILLSVQSTDLSFTLDPDAVVFSSFRGEEVVSIPGGTSPFQNGDPSLPGVSYSIVIPQGTSLENVQIEVLSSIELPGIHSIAPVLSLPLSERIPVVIPHSRNYTEGLFPASSVTNVNTGNKTGFRIASFCYVPFAWNASTGVLSVVTRAVLTPVIVTASDAPLLALSEGQVELAASVLRSTIENPGMLGIFAPEVTGDIDGAAWVAIADESLEATLQPLVDLRSATHGSQFVSTQWLYANYTGRDTQEKIRNYLIDA